MGHWGERLRRAESSCPNTRGVTLTKHEEEMRAMGRGTEKAHTTAIPMSVTPSPDLGASAMVSAQEKRRR